MMTNSTQNWSGAKTYTSISTNMSSSSDAGMLGGRLDKKPPTISSDHQQNYTTTTTTTTTTNRLPPLVKAPSSSSVNSKTIDQFCNASNQQQQCGQSSQQQQQLLSSANNDQLDFVDAVMGSLVVASTGETPTTSTTIGTQTMINVGNQLDSLAQSSMITSSSTGIQCDMMSTKLINFSSPAVHNQPGTSSNIGDVLTPIHHHHHHTDGNHGGVSAMLPLTTTPRPRGEAGRTDGADFRDDNPSQFDGAQVLQLDDGSFALLKPLFDDGLPANGNFEDCSIPNADDTIRTVKFDDGSTMLVAAPSSVLENFPIETMTETVNRNIQAKNRRARAVRRASTRDQTHPDSNAANRGVKSPKKWTLSSESGEERKFVCEYCSKKFTKKSHLKVHERLHTNSKPYSCSFNECEMRFNSTYGLKTHLRTHTNVRPYKCEHCEKCFKTTGDLKKHVRTHTGERPYHCPFEGCDRSFTTSNIRKVHVRLHTGERPFVCDECGKGFSHVTNYKNHMRTHTGERPYICTIDNCGKRFAEYSSLYKHHVVHSPDKPYQCQYCTKNYRQISPLMIHMRVEHGELLLIDNINNSTTTTAATQDGNELEIDMSITPVREKPKLQYILSSSRSTQFQHQNNLTVCKQDPCSSASVSTSNRPELGVKHIPTHIPTTTTTPTYHIPSTTIDICNHPPTTTDSVSDTPANVVVQSLVEEFTRSKTDTMAKERVGGSVSNRGGFNSQGVFVSNQPDQCSKYRECDESGSANVLVQPVNYQTECLNLIPTCADDVSQLNCV